MNSSGIFNTDCQGNFNFSKTITKQNQKNTKKKHPKKSIRTKKCINCSQISSVQLNQITQSEIQAKITVAMSNQ